MLKGFYFDDDSSNKIVVRELAARGLTVVTSNGADLLGAADLEHLRFAASKGLTLVTFNKGDYQRLHAAFLRGNIEHSGIVSGRQQLYSAGEQIRRLHRMAITLSPEQIRNTFEFLSNWGESAERTR